MKKISILLLMLMASSLMSGCSKALSKEKEEANQSQTEIEKVANENKLLTVSDEGITKLDQEVLGAELSKNEKKPLTETEMLSIKFMLEEEKLARDINAKFFEHWSQDIFDKSSSGDHTHIGAIKLLAEKYDIDIAFYDNKLGIFNNTRLKQQFSDGVMKGSSSTLESLAVSASIEEACLSDLARYSKDTRNDDIRLVYENLEKASRNHLRGFVKAILREGGSYEALILDKAEFEGIIATPFDVN